MEPTRRLLDYYLPPVEGFVLESLVSTTYQVDFEFFEEDLLPVALGLRSPVSRARAFRSELERQLQKVEVSVLYDLGGCERLARLSPRIDAIPVVGRKLHSKITLLLWVRDAESSGLRPERRIRLIVGSANLTRQGFRQNYECVAAADFGGRSTSPRSILAKAIALVRQIGAQSGSTQLVRQLAAFESFAAGLTAGTAAPDDPVTLVDAEEVVPTVAATWADVSREPPEKVTVASPFWPEGGAASEALIGLFRRLGDPARVELVCRGERSGDGKHWLPVFDASVATNLRGGIAGRLFLRATSTDTEPVVAATEIGDESEDAELAARLDAGRENTDESQRALHAKVMLLDGRAGSVLYIGSSNCTRRGLGLGGPTNHEAGLVYRLTPRSRKHIDGLLGFAGPPVEVLADSLPTTVQPPPNEAVAVPSFLADVAAVGSLVTIRLREEAPADLVVLMPIPTMAGEAGYWLLYQAGSIAAGPDHPVEVDLASCRKCDDGLQVLTAVPPGDPALPNVFIVARWGGHSAAFPVRFDDKARLPLLVGRRLTEGELIDYYLSGKEPAVGEDGDGLPGTDGEKTIPEAPIDTRRILAYFMRRFVQAIPGLEVEIRRATYSRAALDATLRGPMSPLELAERAVNSLTRPPAWDEPLKTPIAVGFQLTEIVATLRRCEATVDDPDLRQCFVPVVARCRDLLDALIVEQPDLQAVAFRTYVARIVGGDS